MPLVILSPHPAGSSSTPALLFQIAGLAFTLDPALLEAIALVESAGRTDAVSPKGASGLMQLMPDTARRFGVTHPFDPVENVLGAARFLAYMRRNDAIEDLPQLLAAYNAGPGAIGRYGGLPPYPETREYVRRVLTAYLLSDKPVIQSGTPLPVAGQSRVFPRSRWRGSNTARPRTEADVFAQLEQIRSARNRALKLQR